MKWQRFILHPSAFILYEEAGVDDARHGDALGLRQGVAVPCLQDFRVLADRQAAGEVEGAARRLHLYLYGPPPARFCRNLHLRRRNAAQVEAANHHVDRRSALRAEWKDVGDDRELPDVQAVVRVAASGALVVAERDHVAAG